MISWFHYSEVLQPIKKNFGICALYCIVSIFRFFPTESRCFYRNSTAKNVSGWLQLITLISASPHSKRCFCSPKTCSSVCSLIWVFCGLSHAKQHFCFWLLNNHVLSCNIPITSFCFFVIK